LVEAWVLALVLALISAAAVLVVGVVLLSPYQGVPSGLPTALVGWAYLGVLIAAILAFGGVFTLREEFEEEYRTFAIAFMASLSILFAIVGGSLPTTFSPLAPVFVFLLVLGIPIGGWSFQRLFFANFVADKLSRVGPEMVGPP
jgi:hypothetical protein